MDGQKKVYGRSQIYTGERVESAKRSNTDRQVQKLQNGKTADVQNQRTPQKVASLTPLRAENGESSQSARRSQGRPGSSGRRRDQENALKMRGLSVVLGILVLLLIVVIIYEIVLGYGTRQTGAERMAEQAAGAQITDILQNGQTISQCEADSPFWRGLWTTGI